MDSGKRGVNLTAHVAVVDEIFIATKIYKLSA